MFGPRHDDDSLPLDPRSPARGSRCWCGQRATESFGADYRACPACGTLRTRTMPVGDITRVADDETDFYGRRYWFEHQAELAQDDLERRSQRDLHERCLHWLRTVLCTVPRRGRALEVGCAHGGFVYLLREAGFDATGLELSPWVVDFARRTFNVPVRTGPLEDHDFEPSSYDLVVAMDVLEHLPDPVATLERAAALLRDDGVLVLQTPCRPADRDHASLARERHRFLEMLLPGEHLFLFGEASLRRLLRRVGLTHVRFEPAIFDHYDMMAVASRQPLAPRTLPAALAALHADPERRAVAGMVALYDAHEATKQAYRQADADRVGRQAQIETLQETTQRQVPLARRLARLRPAALRMRAERDAAQRALAAEHAKAEELDQERQQLAEQVAGLAAAQAALHAEHAALHASYGTLQTAHDALRGEHERVHEAYGMLHAEHTQLHSTYQALQVEHNALHTDHAAVIDERDATRAERDALHAEAAGYQAGYETLRQRHESLRAEHAHASQALAEHQQALEQATAHGADVTARLAATTDAHQRAVAAFDAVSRTHGRTAAARDRVRTRADALLRASEERFAQLARLTDEIRSGRLYRALVRSGRWRAFDDRLRQAATLKIPAAVDDDVGPEGRDGLDGRIGGEPAPSEASSLIDWSLADWTPPNDRRGDGAVAIDLTALRPHGENGGAGLVSLALAASFIRLRPARRWLLLTTSEAGADADDGLSRLEAAGATRHQVRPEPSALAALRAQTPIDLLFCPMTAPPFADPAVPLVSVVYDLQFLTYPSFFASEECRERDRHFRLAVAASDRVITISDYVRSTVLTHADMPPEHVVTAPIGVLDRFDPASRWSAEQTDAMLDSRGLVRDRFLLYPANLWPHKNHRMLLVALGMVRHQRPDLDVRLVLTGAATPAPAPLLEAADAMGLGDAVVFAGYVSAAELDALYTASRALIFPSLYEGFGMPVLEAMIRGRPVLCSDVTALPEVAGDAALRFDPRVPEAMAEAIVRIVSDDGLATQLAERGRERAEAFADTDAMAKICLRVMDDVLAQPRPMRTALVGIHADAWAGRHLAVTVADGTAGRHLALGFSSPYGVEGALTYTVRATAVRDTTSLETQFTLYRHAPLTLRIALPPAALRLTFEASATFSPTDLGMGDDPRQLAAKIEACRLEAADGSVRDLFADALSFPQDQTHG